MLKSMTGYGRGEAASRDVSVVVELRSVNNRFRDLQLRVPREYMQLEPRITSCLKTPFARGRIDVFVRRSQQHGAQKVVANPAAATAYLSAIEALGVQVKGVDTTVPFSFLLTQPGVLAVAEEEVDALVEWDIVEVALKSAIADLSKMRENEGRALRKDLLENLRETRRVLPEIQAASTGLNERLRQKLETRIRRLVTERVDPHRIVQEAALVADKADVAEELARLKSHCEQFTEALDGKEPVGRRLDFLLQEMNREVNTIGSKAAEHPISRRVVHLKSILERMREQAANVE